MADAWDEYIKKQQSGETSQPVQQAQPKYLWDAPMLGGMFGMFGGSAGSGGSKFSNSNSIKPDARGLYTPSIGEMPVGPPSPIDYGRIRNLLNSGVLKTGEMAPMPATAPAPAPSQPSQQPTDFLGGLLGRIFGLSGEARPWLSMPGRNEEEVNRRNQLAEDMQYIDARKNKQIG
jgi:hypothetical protein